MKNKIYYIIIGLIFAVGILLRILVYSYGRPLWIDEEALAGSIIEAISPEYFFHPLKFFQKAPPLFMYASYLVSNIFGTKEIVLRIIPFLFSLLSIPLFYLVSVSFLQSKKAIIFANFIFVVNYQLIYYSQEFKPYALDMFIALLLIYLSKYVDFNKFSKYQVFLYSLCSIILLLFSFPSMFVIGGIYILNFKKTKDFIKHLLYILPLCTCGVLYYVKLLLPLRDREIKYFISYWDEGFIKLTIGSLIHTIEHNMQYVFYPNKSVILTALFIAGIFLLIKHSNEKIKIYITILLLALGASILHLYPLKGRMILYLLPFILLTVTKPLDLIKCKNTILSLMICTIYLLPFSMYIKQNYYDYFYVKTYFMKQDSRTALEIIMKNIKPEEIITYNYASEPSIYYYSHYFNLDIQNKIIEIKSKNNEKDYLNELNKLDKTKSYWFYYPFHLDKKPESQFVKKWVGQNYLKGEYFTFKKSFVAHIQPK